MDRLTGHAVATALVGLTLALSGCATDRPIVETDARGDPAKAAGPQVDAQLRARASAFESFTRKAAAIDASFAGPAEVRQGLDTGAAYDPKQLGGGLIAFSAMAALQEPRFVAGVRAAGGTPKARQALVRQLARQPASALDLAGGRLAASRANAALLRQAGPLIQSGQGVKRASYSVQKQAWAKAPTADPVGRLTRVKFISSQGYRPERDDEARLQKSIGDGGRQGDGASDAVARGVAIAALTVLGEGRQGRDLMSEPKSDMCLRVAKLNLYQCLASAGPYYEDIYCLGAHAMIEPGQCVAAAAQPSRVRKRASLD